ncbi:MAG TPA: WecB/TagA/CpsF family glycosyltransferase [Patescibacteria group bacterium]|nr:WecB/TagA/CpsF family glycosyltransferase [Patescibacteria group bacterium]
MQNSQNRKSNNTLNKSDNNFLELPKKNILGVDVTNASKENILEFIFKSLKKSTKPYYIVTPNPEMIVLSRKNTAFKNVLNHAKLALNDGVGVGVAGKIMGKTLNDRFTGVDLVEKVCEKGNDWPITVGFLGGRPKVAEKAAECLASRFPSLRIVFIGQEWEKDKIVKGEEYLVSSISYSAKDKIQNKDLIDILFVAFGAPKQELWMAEHVEKIPAKIMAGVGGAFDQIVNPNLRPPHFVQYLGLGWLYRLMRQPWRIRRQFALGEFVWLVVREKLFSTASS